MNTQNPHSLDLEGLRKGVLDRIDNMRKDLLRAVEDWVSILRGHLISTLGFEEVGKARNEMEKLREEIGLLQQSLTTGAAQPGIIRKIMQIDAERLSQSYNGMFLKYRELQQRTDFEIALNWKEIIKSIESNVTMKSKAETEESQEYEQDYKPRSDRTNSLPSKEDPQH
jgi:hypothetical protein